MKNHNKKAKKAIKAMPPITPPTMAPMGVDLVFESFGGVLVVGGVVTAADGVERVGVAEGVTVTVCTESIKEVLPPSRPTWEEVPVGRRVAV